MSDEFDYVVAGGGSAGCVVASRLSEDPRVSVCLLEAGGNGDSWVVTMPFGIAVMLPTPINNWAFHTVPTAGAQRTPRLPAARESVGRIQRDQCHDLHPRPSLGLRPLGFAR